ncbi:MAG: ATP-grasp domain-containing protein [Planctomycetaceae bacterium]
MVVPQGAAGRPKGMPGPSAEHGTGVRCIVVGASARAFAESAARVGWLVHAVDLFNDTDLREAAVESARVADYPLGLPAVVARFPVATVVCTGALENHPDVVEALGRNRPLAGCDADTIRAVRDPTQLAAVVRAAGFEFPETHTAATGVPTDGSYLVKPRASAGGHGIAVWRGTRPDDVRRDLLWQRRIAGRPWSAAWIACRGEAVLVGASRPLRGGAWCCRRFSYCGSIQVPLHAIPDDRRRSLESLGVALTRSFGLVGAFGCDMIATATGPVHVLEVNPRPTASMELIERATGWSVAAAHLGATTVARAADPPGPAVGIWGKAIVFTPEAPRRDAAARIAAAARAWTAVDGLPAIADVPAADEPLAPSAPLVTVFACGTTASGVAAELRKRVALLRTLAADGVSPRAAGA